MLVATFQIVPAMLNVKVEPFRLIVLVFELFDENGTSINQHLIDIGMAYAYDGKTKTDFFTWYKIR